MDSSGTKPTRIKRSALVEAGGVAQKRSLSPPTVNPQWYIFKMHPLVAMTRCSAGISPPPTSLKRSWKQSAALCARQGSATDSKTHITQEEYLWQ
jgi:hypothetical protein